jgi:Glycosyltransferase family 87
VLLIGIIGNNQWDFRVLYAAPATLFTGDNPYDVTNPNLGYPKGLSYLYPPLVLYVLKPLSELPYSTASSIWFALKLLALFVLIRLWDLHFDRLASSRPAILFLAFGLNAPVFKDLAAGNISIFGQLGIWFGFLLLLRDRPYSGDLILAFTAQFKLVRSYY